MPEPDRTGSCRRRCKIRCRSRSCVTIANKQRITHVIATDLTVYCLVTFTTPRLSLGRRGRQSSAYRLRYHSLWLLHFAFPEQICRHNVAVHETINLILCRARTAQRKLLWDIPT